MKNQITPTGHEISLNEEDFIVSKTDIKGRITYANRVFMRISGYPEHELIGVQHNILRHPDMPRCIFKLLWDYIQTGKECFAYTKNLCKNGDHYWVLANVTPDRDNQGHIIGYFSVRRRPREEPVTYIEGLYGQLLAEEKNAGSRDAIEASTTLLQQTISEKGFSGYETFVLGI
jgi:PAS domain S-box-containing protein